MSLKSKTARDNAWGYFFILPFVIGFLFLKLLPFVSSLYLSFTQYNVLSPGKWIGFENYVSMFTKDKLFWQSLWITFKYSVILVPLKLFMALMVALALTRNVRMVSFFRSALYIPSLMGGTVAVALLWKQLFAVDGALNQLLKLLGVGTAVKWLYDPSIALYVLIAQSVWQFGSSMLIFLSALKGMPQQYTDAAVVDGAGAFRRFVSITLPLLSSVIFFNLVNQFIGAMQTFTSSYLITNGGPLNSTLTYGLHLYNKAFINGQMGYGSAMAWFMLLIIGLLTALIFRSSSSWVYYES